MRLGFKELSSVLTHGKVTVHVSFYYAGEDGPDERHGWAQEDEKLWSNQWNKLSNKEKHFSSLNYCRSIKAWWFVCFCTLSAWDHCFCTPYGFLEDFSCQEEELSVSSLRGPHLANSKNGEGWSTQMEGASSTDHCNSPHWKLEHVVRRFKQGLCLSAHGSLAGCPRVSLWASAVPRCSWSKSQNHSWPSDSAAPLPTSW